MSRASLAKRIDRIREHYRPTGSLEGRVDRLNDDDRATFQTCSSRCALIFSRFKNEPGRAYELWLADPMTLPPLPGHVELALFPEMERIEREPNPAIAYSLMLEIGQ